jgi:hypothetical protein
MKYLKTFEGFESSSVQENIADFFKSREDIADALLMALKEDPEKALNAMIPYYEDFLEEYFQDYEGIIPRDKSGRCLLAGENIQMKLGFIPRLAGTMDEPGIFIRKEDGLSRLFPKYAVDRSKLKLAEKITRNEILNLLSPHEDFSLSKLNPIAGFLKSLPRYHPFSMRKDMGELKRLDGEGAPHEDVAQIAPAAMRSMSRPSQADARMAA